MADSKLNEEFSPSSEVLDEIGDVIKTRVTDFTPEEQAIADRITPNIKARLKLEVRQDMEIVLVKRQDEFNEKLRAETMKLTQDNFEKWKEDNKPLEPEDIAKFLTQEYVEFPVKIREGRTKKIREFTLCELVEENEERLIKLFTKHLIPNLQKLNEIDWKQLDSQAERIQALLGVIPDFLAKMAEAVAICLDPYGEQADITPAWVLSNIPSRRMIGIIVAQADANRYRDFLSDGFRLSKMFQKTSTKVLSLQ